jgi:hypothetical protein
MARKDIRAVPAKLLHIEEVVKGYSADSHRSKTNLFSDGQQVPLPEYDQDHLEGQRFADETMLNPQENQGYFLCLVRGQDCKSEREQSSGKPYVSWWAMKLSRNYRTCKSSSFTLQPANLAHQSETNRSFPIVDKPEARQL